MKYSFKSKVHGDVFIGLCKKRLVTAAGRECIPKAHAEYRAIHERAKDIGPKNSLYSAYTMGMAFIAMVRASGLEPRLVCDMLKESLTTNWLTKSLMGNADDYLDPKKMPGRIAWQEKTHERIYENDWVVDVLPACEDYELGYDYTECGICKLFADEGCPEQAHLLCELDYVLADLMGLKLTRTTTLADGCERCDFRYNR